MVESASQDGRSDWGIYIWDWYKVQETCVLAWCREAGRGRLA